MTHGIDASSTSLGKMMKKNLIIFAIIGFFAFSTPAFSQWWVGAGTSYPIALDTLAALNQEKMGINIQLENRGWCALWYGVRVDYNPLDTLKYLPDTLNYYTSIFNISPSVRYNVMDLFKDCNEYDIVPYVQMLLDFSYIRGTDNNTDFGIGMSGGLGCAYTWSMLSKCWMIDLNLLYRAPNTFVRDSQRPPLHTVNISCSLSMRL
jgi:hypothetical protein